MNIPVMPSHTTWNDPDSYSSNTSLVGQHRSKNLKVVVMVRRRWSIVPCDRRNDERLAQLDRNIQAIRVPPEFRAGLKVRGYRVERRNIVPRDVNKWSSPFDAGRSPGGIVDSSIECDRLVREELVCDVVRRRRVEEFPGVRDRGRR